MDIPQYIQSYTEPKKADYEQAVEGWHLMLDGYGIPRGDEKGAYTLAWRIYLLAGAAARWQATS